MRIPVLTLLLIAPAAQATNAIFDGSNPMPHHGGGFEHHGGGFGHHHGGGIPNPGHGGGWGGNPPPVTGNPPPTTGNPPPPAPIPQVINHGGQGGTGGQGGRGGQGGQGGNIQRGAVTNNVTGGGVNIRYPQQAPNTFVSGYGSYSPSSCLGSVGLGGSGPGASGTLLFPYESDPCNYRQNSAQMDAYGYHKTACQIMRDNFEEVDEAMKKTGEDCAKPMERLASMPYPGAVVNATPPAPDGDYVTRPELDNAFKKAVGK